MSTKMVRSLVRTIVGSILFGVLLLITHTIISQEKGYVLITPDIFDGLDIAHYIQDIVYSAREKNMLDDLPAGVLRAYTMLQEGKTDLRVDDLAECLPFISEKVLCELLQYEEFPDRKVNVVVNVDLVQIFNSISKLKKVMQDVGVATHDQFIETWTALAAMDVVAEVDLLGVFTVVQQLNNLLEISEHETADKFVGTWTSLTHAHTDLSEQLRELQEQNTTCCNDLANKFASTWTMIEGIDVVAEVDLLGVFTVVQQLNNLLGIAEQETADKFVGTWTSLTHAHTDLSEQLRELQEQNTTCCNELANKFASTWTMIEGIDVVAEVDLQDVFTAVSAVRVAVQDVNMLVQNAQQLLSDKFQGTYTALSAMTLCSAIQLTGSGPITISASGVYCLTGDVSTSGVAITVAANNVVLDLNGYRVTRTDAGDVIAISSGTSNISIKNGEIKTTVASSTGIHAIGTTKTLFDGLLFNHVSSTSTVGILIDSSSQCSTIRNCTFLGGAYGVDVTSSSEGLLQDCSIDAAGVGVRMTTVAASKIINSTCIGNVNQGILYNGGCRNCVVEGCVISGQTVGAGIGILSSSSTGISIKNNVIQGNAASGISIGVGCQSITIQNNEIVGNGTDGITVSVSSRSVSIEDNRVADNGNNGISGIFVASILKNNQISGDLSIQNVGISLLSGSSVVFVGGNVIAQQQSSGILSVGSNVVFNTNQCCENGASGIHLVNGSTNCTLSGNIANNNSADGIRIENGSSSHNISQNICDMNGAYGYNKETAIENCSFTQNKGCKNGTANYRSTTPSSTITTLTIAGLFGLVSSPFANLSVN